MTRSSCSAGNALAAVLEPPGGMQPEGGVPGRAWDIRRDNPRREIGGRPIDSEIEQETIRAVVTAYAEGRIELPRLPGPKARGVRYAPSFRIAVVPNGLRDKPYNAESIAKFLGWMSGRSIGSEITSRLVAEVDGGLAIG